MANYVIGDIQGCYTPLMRLLDQIHFNEQCDRLWFVGDLVNRGPDSLSVLRFVKQLPLTPYIALGNHDLHLLSRLFIPNTQASPGDTLDAVLQADEAEALGHWLRQQSLLIYDPHFKVLGVHAGIPPFWNLDQAIFYAQEVETALRSEDFRLFLSDMYGNQPACWQDDLTGHARLRFMVNAFTRMRFCDAQGCLQLEYKGTLAQAPPNIIPWYAVPRRVPIDADIVFGHWAALKGECPVSGVYAIDTGCVWGGALTALRLEDRQRFSVVG